jgi:hypothetical protein
MSVWHDYKLTDLATGQIRDLSGCAGAFYQLHNGKRIKVHAEIGWRHVCDDFKSVEELGSVERLEHNLNLLRDPVRRYELIPGLSNEEEMNELINQAVLRIEWRKKRVSPAKCLTCGSTRLMKVQLEMPMLHPLWGNKVQIDLGEVQFARLRYEKIYSSDGEFIESE